MADTELIAVVNRLARLGFTRSQIEWFTSSFDDYEEEVDELVANYEAGVEETTIDVTRERTYMAEARINPGQDCNRAANARISDFVATTDRWESSATRFAFVGPPNRVRLNVSFTARYSGADQNNPGRAEPTIQFQRTNDSGRTWEDVGTPGGCYIRMFNHAVGHCSLYVVDTTPGFRPQYRFRFGQGNEAQGVPIGVVAGVVQAEALIEDQITILKF